ncbi:MAG: nuclear transport factor 2 family protein [Rhizomicrobium sp.]|nr:nuclear transport factor 2 family protein [Rhizomicrobium sp.]
MATALTDVWWDMLHQDVVFEFPYAPSLGTPDRFEGRESAEAYLRAMVAQLGALKFKNIVVMGTTDPAVFFNEYSATLTTPRGTMYDQVYINKIEVRDGKVVLFREFWDPARVMKAVNDFTAG